MWLQGCRGTGMQGYRGTGMQGYKVTMDMIEADE